MTHGFDSLLAYLRRISLQSTHRESDTELLTRYVKFRDAVAFELLFWRHGPMVHGVCQRLLGDSPDAEDAFQAVFVVLARKASSIGRKASLAGWLHRVARHTALNARKTLSRRQAHEQTVREHDLPVRQDDPSRLAAANELKALIDQEIDQLPERLRLPLILCDMESRTHESAADELRCPLGTLESRLSRARARLKERLLRRDISLTVFASSPVSLKTAAAALRNASRPTAGPVLALAESVIWSLTLSGAKKLVAGLAVCCLVALGIAGGIAAGGSEGRDRPSESPPAAAISQERPVEKLNFIDPDAGPLPDGAVARIGSLRFRHADLVTGLKYSPDGKWLASISTAPGDATARLWDAAGGKEQLRVKVVGAPIDANGNARNYTRDSFEALGFSSNAKQFLVVDAASIRSFDIATGKELFAHTIVADKPANLAKALPKARLANIFPLIGAAISPDGNSVVLFWTSGRFEILDTATGAVRIKGEHPRGGGFRSHSSVEFSPDSRRFVISAGDNLPNPVFDTASGQLLFNVQASGKGIQRLVFVRGGESLVSLVSTKAGAYPDSGGFFDGKTGELLRTVEVADTTSEFAISPDGKWLVAGNGQRRFSQIIDTSTGKEIGRIASLPTLVHFAFSPDGKHLAGTRSWGGAIMVWDVANRRYYPTAEEPVYFNGTTFSADGKALIFPGRGRISVNWRTGKAIHRLMDVEVDLFQTQLSFDQKVYAVPEGRGPIRLLDAETGKESRTLTGHSSVASKLAFSGDDKRLASCSFDKSIRVWDVAGAKEIAQFTPPEIFGSDYIAFSENGHILAASFNQVGPKIRGNIIYSWNVDAKTKLARIEAPDRFFSGIDLSNDGRLLAGGSERVTIWYASSGRVLHSLTGHDVKNLRPGTWCRFSPNGQWLVTGDAAGRLRLWEVLSGKEVYSFDGHRTAISSAFFSPDGRLLVAASEDAPCFIWDVTGTASGTPKEANIDGEQLWRELADADAKKAFLAVRKLAAHPGFAVEMIRKNLNSAPSLDNSKVEMLLRDLDSTAYAVRERAATELTKIAERIEPALAKARESASLEVRSRLDGILEKTAMPSPERLRQSRAVGVLELIATPDAAKLLADLAAGNKLDSLTAASAAASERLRAREVK